jgi:Domain of unknown function (DUF3425)
VPALLRPSEKQLRVPHDPFIDGLPWPGLRDALIDHQAKESMDELLVHTIAETVLHDGDTLSESNWELALPFLVKYR